MYRRSTFSKECMALCSMFIEGFDSKHNRPSCNDDNDVSLGTTLFPRVGSPLGKPGRYVLRGLEKVQAHRYVLFKCSDVNIAHAEYITNKRNGHRVSQKAIEKIQNEKFHQWFMSHIMKMERKSSNHNIKDDI
ncbi:hypothetical protein QOZ80_1AG0021430 [Eleusine coracana subsp. coracana]|nr:hypothetical protein QOZ80_1AG0021430 [Eleusine coracana subsp. coracana]